MDGIVTDGTAVDTLGTKDSGTRVSPPPAASAPPVTAASEETSARKRPLWQEISGLLPEAEGKMTRQERRIAIRKLMRHVEKMAREILAEHANDPDKNERSYLWDPLATICFELGIVRRRLSAYSKELTGMAAHEIVDKIRAEDVKAKMRADLCRFIRRNWDEPGKWPNHMMKYSNSLRWEFYWMMRRLRCGSPDYEPVVVAMDYGFPNEARYRRACVLCYGKTPHQLAFEVLSDIAEYYECANDLTRRRCAIDDPRRNQNIAQLATRPFSDAWAVARREKPEWLGKMRAELGLVDKNVPLADE